jgi:hypothetical protein
MEEFVQQFTLLKNRAGFDETALIAIFKNGIRRHILQIIYSQPQLPDTLRGWMDIAMRLDRHQREFNQGQRWAPAQQRWNNNPQQNQSQQRGNFNTRQPQQQQQQQPRQPQNQQQRQRPLPPGEPMEIDQRQGGQNCFFCGIFGHMARNCRQKINGCFNCGRKGHARNNCTQAPRIQPQQVRQIQNEPPPQRVRRVQIEEVDVDMESASILGKEEA